MRLLFDQNLSYRLCRSLQDLFPESSQVQLLSMQSAKDNAFALVTLDADFAGLAGLRGAPPKVIWLRCGNQRVDTVANILKIHAPQIMLFLEQDLRDTRIRCFNC